MELRPEEIQYSIIYDVNIYCESGEDRPGEFRPFTITKCSPQGGLARKFWRTETSSSAFDEATVHGKWCGVLNYTEFRQFLADTYLEVEEVHTMGSMGAPGFDFNWTPAVCFQYWDLYGGWYLRSSAYVTPLLTQEQAAAWGLVDGDNDAWEFIEKEMWHHGW